jgi:hypothetical protein
MNFARQSYSIRILFRWTYRALRKQFISIIGVGVGEGKISTQLGLSERASAAIETGCFLRANSIGRRSINHALKKFHTRIHEILNSNLDSSLRASGCLNATPGHVIFRLLPPVKRRNFHKASSKLMK